MVTHLFVYSSKTKRFWCTVMRLSTLEEIFIFLYYVVFGFLEADDKVFLMLNHLLLLFKYDVNLMSQEVQNFFLLKPS